MLSDALLDALQAQAAPHGDPTTEAPGIAALPGQTCPVRAGPRWRPARSS